VQAEPLRRVVERLDRPAIKLRHQWICTNLHAHARSHACMLSKHVRTYTHAHAHMHARMHVHMHTQSQAPSPTPITPASSIFPEPCWGPSPWEFGSSTPVPRGKHFAKNQPGHRLASFKFFRTFILSPNLWWQNRTEICRFAVAAQGLIVPFPPWAASRCVWAHRV